MLSYSPDLVCLQEVDERVFRELLSPVLLSSGLAGFHHSKCGNTREGAALFYRLERLACMGTFDFEMREAFDRKDNPFKPLQDRYPALRAILCEKLTTVGQIVLLRLEMATLVREMTARQGEIEDKFGVRPRLVLCGDLNSTPTTATIRYLRGETIGPEDEVWEHLHVFGWGKRQGEGEEKEEGEAAATAAVLEAEEGKKGGEEGGDGKAVAVDDGRESRGRETLLSSRATPRVEAREEKEKEKNSKEKGSMASDGDVIPTLCLTRPFFSACGLPDFTNYVQGFVETLDYIFLESEAPVPLDPSGASFSVLSVGAMPTREEAGQDTALPSWQAPSDHVSILCDVRVQ
ncbi:2 -phosphodiesterase 12-like protein [Nannochloropsis gaditana CCMP526]|uniref:2 -phosphodiesterase 12-like protein n=1 Tax=Nannochloropsis gaditana (strain CCMP526) TaxID=1093141 RepID=UPI00029F7A56|nr:2 -phosphodiesterase 12-like protein [Nannochloropsis gaditana CCMP526]EKU22164.1 2 -phosphodiesterase 12-like protein [Nannochloropsis gaditana CCMP526]|eukprot:XP_005854200.1 2 -phosphodiesterase 12-like protein [Nannochloropsis gaditana CCMP526]